MAWRHPSRRWRAALVAALLTFGAYVPEAKSDIAEIYEYEVMILRVAGSSESLPSDSALCRWWYLRPDTDTLILSPIVPRGWSAALGCEAVLIWMEIEGQL